MSTQAPPRCHPGRRDREGAVLSVAKDLGSLLHLARNDEMLHVVRHATLRATPR